MNYIVLCLGLITQEYLSLIMLAVFHANMSVCFPSWEMGDEEKDQ